MNKGNTPTFSFIKILSTISEGDDWGSKSRKAMLEMAKPVTCLTLEHLPVSIQNELKDAIKKNEPQKGMCHDNAWKLCVYSEGNIKIVSGFADSIIPMEHSWIRIENQDGIFDFDPTDHSVFNGGQFKDYFEIYNLEKKEALKRAIDSGHSGPWMMEKTLNFLGVDEQVVSKRKSFKSR